MRRRSVKTGKNVGIRYEERINHILKEKGFQPSDVDSAGPSLKPDGYFRHEKKYYPIEIKSSLSADFAQIELNWDSVKRFYYSEYTHNPVFRELMIKEKSFLEEINRRWTKTPRWFTKQEKVSADRLYDLSNFENFIRDVEVDYIEQYYNGKEEPIYYIQIGGKGFFYMGKDILNLGVPRLNGKGFLRARVKTRSATNNKWGFLVAIKLKSVTASEFDLEELKGRSFPFSYTPDELPPMKKQQSLNDFL